MAVLYIQTTAGLLKISGEKITKEKKNHFLAGIHTI